jgi:zinc protease
MGLDTDLPNLVKIQNVTEGVRCLVYTNKQNPTLTVFGSIRAGMAFEPPDKPGLAELTARQLVRGSAKLGPARLANTLESVGAVASFRNTQDNITFHAKTTSQWTKRVLDVISECLTRPAFRARDVEKEKEQLLTDIRLRDEDTTRRGLRELQEAVYPKEHPYRRDRHGTPESVKRLDRDDLKDYFDNTVTKAPVILSFAGDIESEDAGKWAAKTFAGRKDTGLRSDVKDRMTTSEIGGITKEVVMEHKSQSDIVMGCLACAREDPDYEPLNLLNVIVGELGFMGRLGQRVRDQEGLAYSATSFLITGILGGNWAALSGVNPKNVEKATRLIKEEISRAQSQEVTMEELDAAKQNQIGSALMELESTEGVARTSHNLTYYGLGLDYFSKRRTLYEKIGPETLLNVAKTYLEPSRLSTIIVGPKMKV